MENDEIELRGKGRPKAPTPQYNIPQHLARYIPKKYIKEIKSHLSNENN